MPRRVLSAVVLATALLLAAGCGGSSDDSAQSGLAAAMDSVAGSGPAAQYFEYGDLAALRKLGVVDPRANAEGSGTLIDPRWSTVAGVGASDLAAYSAVLPKLIDLNVLESDRAVAIGNPPDRATRIDGSLDSKAISAKLTALGAEPRSFGDTDGLSFGPDNQVNLSSKLGRDLNYSALAITLNQLAVTDGTFATSRNAATLEKVLDPGSTSLLDTAHFGDLADCLGDVVAAIVLAPQQDNNAALVGVGVRTPDSADAAVDDVLCVLPKPGRHDTVHESMAQRLATKSTDPATNSPISTYAAKTVVDDAGDLVRAVVTLQAKAPTGYLIQALIRNAVAYWDGSCTDTAIAQRTC